jgi:hypothetical protein
MTTGSKLSGNRLHPRISGDLRPRQRGGIGPGERLVERDLASDSLRRVTASEPC